MREIFWRRLDALLRMSRPPSRRRVMDLGGGNGVLLPTLSQRYDEVFCVDPRNEVAAEVVAHAGLPNVTVESDPLESLDWEDNRFDTVVAADTLEHIHNLPLLGERIRRLLRPGGELLVSSPCEGGFYQLGRRLCGYTRPEDHYHDARSVEEELARLLEPTHQRFFPLPGSWLGVFSLARFELV